MATVLVPLAQGCEELEAVAKAEILALRVIAEQLEYRESRPFPINISIPIKAYGAVSD